MRKAFRHSGVLMMLAVVALGLVGAGYALWYEELTLTATVETGTFDADWSLHTVPATSGIAATDALPVVCTKEPAGSTADLGTNCDAAADYVDALAVKRAELGGDPSYGANTRVAAKMPTCDADISANSASEEANDTADENQLTLTLSNAYPYSGCKFVIDVTNHGTVPMHFTFESLSPAPSPFVGLISTSNVALTTPQNGNFSGLEAAQAARFCAAIGTAFQGEMKASTTSYVQLHAGESIYCDLLLYLKEYDQDRHVVPEKLTGDKALSFSWEIIAHQWNEEVTPANHAD